MKFLGMISHLSNSGKLIARSSQTPPLGAIVFDKDKKKIGKIGNVFGPTKEPYISIIIYHSIDSKKFENSYGKDLYFSSNNKKRRGRKTRKKK